MHDKPKSYMLKALKEANILAYKSSKGAYILLIFISILSAVNVFIELKSTEYTVNAAYDLFNKRVDFQTVLIGISAFTAAAVFFKVIDVIKTLVTNKLFLNISYAFEHDLNSKLSSIRWDYYESNETYVRIHEVRTKSLDAIKKFVTSTMDYVQSILLIVVFGYFLAQINIFAVIVYFILIIALNKISISIYNQIANIWDEIQPINQKQSYFFNLSGDKVTHQEFKFNRLFGFVRDRWNRLYDSEYKLRMKIFGKYEIAFQTARLLFNIPYIAMMIYVSFEISAGKHELGFLLMCNSLFNHVIDTIAGVQQAITSNQVESRFIMAFDEIMGFKEDIPYKSQNTAGSISFEKIIYSYPQSSSYSLNMLDLNINKGEKIAIVGHNGSGKTTFTNLLMGLTDDFSGQIAVDGKPSDEAHAILRSSVSCILQDFAQYQMTIRENIELGYSIHHFSDSEITELLDKVGLKEIVEAMPDGINTQLGQLDNGIELSKGQWQRLAIARLLANPNASCWILDEPTAYLDPLSEIEIYDLIYELAGDRAVLFISHRLGFAKRADRIVVFESGKIAEQGMHQELLNKKGIYSEMYENQKSWYAA